MVGNRTFPLEFAQCGHGTQVFANATALMLYEAMPVEHFWSYEFPLLPLTACFRGYGWTFFAVGITSLLLGLTCAIVTWILLGEAWQRVFLYALVAVSGLTRGIFCLVATGKLYSIDRVGDLYRHSDWFLDYLLPVNAAADLVASWVDLLLAFFWMRAMGNAGPSRPIVFGGLCTASTALLIACIAVDAPHLQRIKERAQTDRDAGIELWYMTLLFVALLMTVTALVHSVTVTYLLVQFVRRGLLRFRELRLAVTRISAIALVTMVACVMRGVVLLLRLFRVYTFEAGVLSFNDPRWTAAYYLGLVTVPAVVVCVAYGPIVLERLRSRLVGEGSYRCFRDEEGDEPSTDAFVLDD